MSTCADILTEAVFTLEPDETIDRAAGRMLRAHVSGCPVVDSENRVVGVLSEIDLLRALYPAHQGEIPTGTVREHMTPNPVALRPDTPAIEAAHFFFEYPLRRAPIVDDAGRLIGLVSRRDVLRATEALARDLRLHRSP